jgi:hypothetical protein
MPRYGGSSGFTSTTIGQVLLAQDASDLHISWTSTEPEGACFQVYVNRRLQWSGTPRAITLPVPDGFASIHVGSVPATLASTDFSSSLDSPASAGDRAILSWLGGTYLDPRGNDDVAGFHIYASPAPDTPPAYTKPIATLAAYPGGAITDGFGLGGFGQGGYGKAASSYQWTSPRLGSGTWQFDVRPFNAAGNEPANTIPKSLTITAPPAPSAPNALGQRLAYTYKPADHTATLTWLPSPG